MKVGDRVVVVGKISQWMYDGLGTGPWNLVVTSTTDERFLDDDSLCTVQDINTGRKTIMYKRRLEPILAFTLPDSLFTID